MASVHVCSTRVIKHIGSTYPATDTGSTWTAEGRILLEPHRLGARERKSDRERESRIENETNRQLKIKIRNRQSEKGRKQTQGKRQSHCECKRRGRDTTTDAVAACKKRVCVCIWKPIPHSTRPRYSETTRTLQHDSKPPRAKHRKDT